MECKFQVGQKVVCVDDRPGRSTPSVPNALVIGDMDGLTMGAVYTVREIFFDDGWGDVSIRLVEITRQLSRLNGVWFESGFAPDRFRPLVTRKTDISCFTALLNTQRTRIPA